MTNEIKSRIDYYVSKLGRWPHVTNLAHDFNVSREQAKVYLDEYRELIKRPIMAQSPAEPSKQEVPRITRQQFDNISKKEETKETNNLHEAVVKQGGGIIALRIISGIVALACMIRGFIVIVEINTVIGWQGYLNAIIFQGGSAVLPIVGMLYFSFVKKDRLVYVLFGAFYIIGGIGSMMYEVYASSQAFHQTNIKQEISVQKEFSSDNDSILQSIQEQINSENTNMARIVSNLSKRQAELSLLSPKDSLYPAAARRVSANLADQSKSQDNLNELGKKKTERLLLLEEKSGKQSSVVSLVKNNDFIELIITLIPSMMMVCFTPIFFSISLFGVSNEKRKYKEIELSRGMVSIIDEEDFERCSKHNWCILEIGIGRYYGYSTTKKNRMLLHRFILNNFDKRFVVDHINNNGLDNRKKNLRICTQSQNIINNRRKNGKCLRGVTMQNGKFKAQIYRQGHNVHLGMFYSEIEAYNAYMKEALKKDSEFIPEHLLNRNI